MSEDIDGTSPADVLIRRGKLGLANRPCDCAEHLALLADAMAETARGMKWVAHYAEDVEEEMRSALSEHAEQLAGAARMAGNWANAIQAA